MTSEMTFLDHLADLRKRLIHAFLGVIVCFVIVYTYSDQIFDLLMRPLCESFKNGNCQLITIGVAEAFIVYLKTGLVGGIFLGSPWVFYQLWKFISPGLHQNEKKYIVPFIFSASLMFIGGACFGYFYMFPFAFKYLMSVSGSHIVPMPSMDLYFTFASTLLFAFGALFEIPILVVLLNLLGVLEARSLWNTWRYAIVIIFALSAILTPADPITMLMLGIPLTILYLSSLVACSLLERARKKRTPENPV